ncbi:MAG: MBOAT family protein [Cyclobacteriaceae bacterium]|nr:MBOAT family protein [Cyclobacteriaceae bacterium]
MIEWLEYIFFFWEDPVGSGMSDGLFFTKIHFWIFLLLVLAIQSLIEEGSKWYTAMLFSTVTAVLGLLYFTWSQLGPVFICWSTFAFFIIYYAMRNHKTASRNAFLFAASLFFYYKTSGFFFLILVFSTLVNYAGGIGIHRAQALRSKKGILALSITINLLVLFYFKYAYFFTDSYNLFVSSFNEFWNTNIGEYLQVKNVLAAWVNDQFGGTFRVEKILLPVGISFYTFQTISYIVDVYRKEVQPVYNILDFGFYVSFFPQLVAGPIVRAKHFIPQLNNLHQITRHDFGIGLFWILNGLLKKAFLADFLANGFIDGVFEDPLRFTGFENLMAIIGYTMQVYADFSGYTDIAIGIALLIGFRLNTNFNSPYKALHVGEFWQRWHISLSTWLKDYLYIPLGGNKVGTLTTYICISGIMIIMIALSGKLWVQVGIVFLIATLALIIISRISPSFRNWINTNINIMITMLLGGLWHGASWNFVIWGGLNGLGVVFYKLWRSISPWEKSNHVLARIWKITVTLSFITFTRIFFRSSDMETANQMMTQIGTQFHASVIPRAIRAYDIYFVVLLLGFIIHWLNSDFKTKYREFFANLHWGYQAAITLVVIYLAHQSLQASQPFIYFQF